MSWADHAGDPLPDGHPERFAHRSTWRRQPGRATLVTVVAAVAGAVGLASWPRRSRRSQ